MHLNNRFWLLVVGAITLLALFFRTWQLDTIPNGLNRDEAALGYNAFLLAETGKDEWGVSQPVSLRSFGDYKLAGSVWAMIPFVQLFGFSNWAVRLPIALAGTALVPLVYLLSRRLGLDRVSSLAPTALTAFSPVFIFFSRFGFEAILALAMLIGSLVLFLTKKPTLTSDTSGALLFFVACLTYNTPLLLTPVVLLLILASRGLLDWKKWRVAVALIAIASLIAYALVAPAASSKQAITIFSDPTITANYPAYRASFSGVFQTVLGNSTVYYVSLIVQRLLAFFSPGFLVTTGGSHPWHQLSNGYAHVIAPTYGLALVSVLFAMVAIVHNWKKMLSKKMLHANLLDAQCGKCAVLLASLFASLLIPSITVDAPHATRSLFSLIILFILIGVAIFTFKQAFKHKPKRLAVLTALLLANFSWQTYGYIAQYFSTYSETSVAATRSGLAQAVAREETNADPAAPIIVVDPDGYEYIRVAWDEQLSADAFLSSIQRESPNTLGFTPATHVGRYVFVRTQQAVPPGSSYYMWNESSWQKSD